MTYSVEKQKILKVKSEAHRTFSGAKERKAMSAVPG